MTAVEYLEKMLKQSCGKEFTEGYKELFDKAKKMEIEQSQEYAGFTVECYKMDIPLITFDSYIKL